MFEIDDSRWRPDGSASFDLQRGLIAMLRDVGVGLVCSFTEKPLSTGWVGTLWRCEKSTSSDVQAELARIR
ncbi:MAG TPA: hypothetical protein VNH11_21645 [Pirellulales bacterium]|nr:hypothetical protein [Pirellulales bacterium]